MVLQNIDLTVLLIKCLVLYDLSANTNGGLRTNPIDPDSGERERPEGVVEAEDSGRH